MIKLKKLCFGVLYVCTYTYIHAYSHTSMPAHATYTCVHILVHAYTYVHNVHMYTCIHMCTHTGTPYVCTYMYTTFFSYIQEKRRNPRKSCQQMDSDNNLFTKIYTRAFSTIYYKKQETTLKINHFKIGNGSCHSHMGRDWLISG